METDEWIVIGAMIFVALVGVFLIKLSLSRITSGSLYVVLFAILLILGALGVILYGLYENKEPIWWIIPTGVIGFLVIFLVLFIVFGNKKTRISPVTTVTVDGTVTEDDFKINELRVKTLKEGLLQRDEPEKRRYIRGYDLLGDLIGIKPPERETVKDLYGTPYSKNPLSEEQKQELKNAILNESKNPYFSSVQAKQQYLELGRYVPGL